MLQIERQEKILSLLSENAARRVGQLASALYISEATVRRDLSAMEKKGLVRRVYGGVLLAKDDLPLVLRTKENAAAKEEIGAKAAALIKDGSTVFLDASSTALHILPHLSRFRDLTVITNSHRATELLAGGGCRLFCTGGELLRRNMAYVGSVAEATLQNFHIDLAFFSSQGVSNTGEITDSSESETALRRVVLRRTATAVFLADAGKVGKQYLFRLGDLSDMHHVITDAAFPVALLPR